MFLTQIEVLSHTRRLKSIEKSAFKMAPKVMSLRLDAYCLRCIFIGILGIIQMSPLTQKRGFTNTFGKIDLIDFGKPKSQEFKGLDKI